jgi:acetylornithine/succinyldiaminopimelate/putrescine aminotransferase/predicted amino acid dehydrogenase
MMDTQALLVHLKSRGVELWVDDGRLRYRSTLGLMTEELRAELVGRRAELLESLRPDPAPARSKFKLFGDCENEELDDHGQLDENMEECDHPYGRFVSPYKTSLLSVLRMDKRFTRGEGCYLEDHEGNRYLDFIAQYGALPFGYNPPEIWSALDSARASALPSFVQNALSDPAGELARRLVGLAPGQRYVTFANSGAEAIEVAIKLCRAATGRIGILSTRLGFHGLTLGALSATGKALYQRPFGAPVPGFETVPYDDLGALEQALAGVGGPFAAFLVEPIQGEGGIVAPRAGYLARAHDLCRRAGTLMVVDEVQTGLGRTGALFACERDGVEPDVLTLAKALGGGLFPIAACLYRRSVHTRRFEIRHSSTFAGNALGCMAGLATLDLLERDDRRLVRAVAEQGEQLRDGLERLARVYPGLIADVRGRGFMLGVQFDFESIGRRPGLIGCLAQQDLLVLIVASYLLNVERVRLSPSFTVGDVLRVEPPLIAGRAECGAFLAALDRTLAVLADGDSARLLGHLVRGTSACSTGLVGRAGDEAVPRRTATVAVPTADGPAGRPSFAFVVHLMSPGDYAEYDPGLAAFGPEEIAELKRRMVDFLDPFPVGSIAVESTSGARVEGELVLVPYTAAELMTMPAERSCAEIRLAVEVAGRRGARVVGLGGFTSVVTQGGLALSADRLPRLTTGNAYTVVAARRAVLGACRQREVDPAGANIAVIGATGMIGQATAALLGEVAGRLALIGNPRHPQHSRRRLLEVAARVLAHLWDGAGSSPRPGTLAARLEKLAPKDRGRPSPEDLLRIAHEIEVGSDALVLTTDLNQVIASADVVVTATNSLEALVLAADLKPSAIVCDISRPLNVCRSVRESRPDVLLIEGGVVRVPGPVDLDLRAGLEPGVVFACVAETMLLALEPSHRFDGLCGSLDLRTVLELEALGERHGFEILI